MKKCISIGSVLIALVTTLGASGCSASTHSAPWSQQVTQYGAMKPVMRQGKTQPRIRLSDAVTRTGAIGVGALEGLAGEITMVDGQVWVSRTANGQLAVVGPEAVEADQATLLTLAHVAHWQSITIDAPLEGAKLELFIAQVAKDYGLDTSEPFPFVIEGRLTHIDLHVINGYCPIATDPATINAQPWRMSNAEEVDAKIVGFYAPDAAGVMTHHGTSLHAHGIISLDGRIFAGHMDRVVIEPGMILRVPMNE